MNGRVARLLTRLYPRAWRERYGAEFEAFLQDGPGDLRTSANVIWSAYISNSRRQYGSTNQFLRRHH